MATVRPFFFRRYQIKSEIYRISHFRNFLRDFFPTQKLKRRPSTASSVLAYFDLFVSLTFPSDPSRSRAVPVSSVATPDSRLHTQVHTVYFLPRVLYIHIGFFFLYIIIFLSRREEFPNA